MMKLNYKIVFIILTLVAIGGVVALGYYRGKIFSQENLTVEILGQDTVSLGQEIEYAVRYKNNGDFILQNLLTKHHIFLSKYF